MYLIILLDAYMSLQKNKLKWQIFFVLSFVSFTLSANERIDIADFSQNDKTGWQSHSFKDETNYQLVKDDNLTVLQAKSHNSASGLVKKVSVNLNETPYLNWSWKVDHSLYRLAEDLKQGDDFAARIYVIIDGGLLFWRTLALNYVWASGKPVQSMWENPFTSNAMMLAIESGDKLKNQWISEKRNVRQDLIKAFGRDFEFIDAVAIMTDTDNSGQQATAYYADIFFTSE